MSPPLGPPTFDVVSDALEIHCGTINCHGNDARNMRFYGFYGVRASADDQTGARPTTGDEYKRNYESIIAIEPEKISQIYLSGGQNSGKWIVLSKGRGTEHHKGGSRIVPGDALDTCLLSWLLTRVPVVSDGGTFVTTDGAIPGTLNMSACIAAVTILPPGADWTQ